MWGWLIGARGSGALAQTPRGALVWTQVISQTLFRDQTTLFQTMLNRQVEAEKHLLGRELFISSPGSFRHSSGMLLADKLTRFLSVTTFRD